MPRSSVKKTKDEVDKIIKKVTTKPKKKTTTAKKAPATKKTSVTKKSTSPSKSKASAIKKLKEVSEKFLDIVEYYDLPYRYNQTVVKVLAQNPNMLFVYWDVSDKDIDNFKKEFGENFLEITKPVLVVHNVTNNYSFEIDINDFANNWYVNVDDTKCKYVVELGRRPIESNTIQNISNNTSTNFVEVLSSNTIEIPNDHVLFYKNGDVIQFKNLKTNDITEIKVKASSVKSIYKNFTLLDDENKFDFDNPSSQNPTSNVM